LAISMALGASLLLAPFLLPALFGAAFDAAVAPLAVLILASIGLAVVSMLTPLLNATGATWTITRMVFVAAAVNLALDLALIPTLGIVGAALATLGSYAVSLGLVLRS